MKTPHRPLHPARAAARPRAAFSLVEVLVATAVLLAIVAMLGSIVSNVSKIWASANGKTQRQIIARTLVQYIAKDLQCILPPESRGPGDSREASRLQFLVNTGIPATLKSGSDRILNPQALFFQAPVAANTALGNIAEVGYFVRWGTSGTGAGAIPVARLCRFYADPGTRTPTGGSVNEQGVGNAFLLYDDAPPVSGTDTTTPPPHWTSNIDALTPAEPPTYGGWMADNVIAFFARCTTNMGDAIEKNAAGAAFETADRFAFDSHKGYSDPLNSTVTLPGPVLPPVVDIAMVILDAKAAQRLNNDTRDAIRARLATYNNPARFHESLQDFMAWLSTPASQGGPNVYLGDGAEAFSVTVLLPRPPL